MAYHRHAEILTLCGNVINILQGNIDIVVGDTGMYAEKAREWRSMRPFR